MMIIFLVLYVYSAQYLPLTVATVYIETILGKVRVIVLICRSLAVMEA